MGRTTQTTRTTPVPSRASAVRLPIGRWDRSDSNPLVTAEEACKPGLPQSCQGGLTQPPDDHAQDHYRHPIHEIGVAIHQGYKAISLLKPQ